MRYFPITLLMASLALIPPARAMTPEERREHLDKLLKILPDAPQFRRWVDKTGALPPDFSAESEWPAGSAGMSGRKTSAQRPRLEIAPRRDLAAIPELNVDGCDAAVTP
jgi:hypothetical protein